MMQKKITNRKKCYCRSEMLLGSDFFCAITGKMLIAGALLKGEIPLKWPESCRDLPRIALKTGKRYLRERYNGF